MKMATALVLFSSKGHKINNIVINLIALQAFSTMIKPSNALGTVILRKQVIMTKSSLTEDDWEIRELVSEALKDEGFEVDEAENGRVCSISYIITPTTFSLGHHDAAVGWVTYS